MVHSINLNQLARDCVPDLFAGILGNHGGGRNTPPAILLRESYRENGKVRKRTIANITKWPQNIIAAIEAACKNVDLVPKSQHLTIEASRPHGHVALVLGVIRELGVDRIISSQSTRQRNLVIAMISERLINPCSKLAMTRLWHTTSLAQELGVENVDVADVYDALDWLWERKERIEKKLAARHLTDGGYVFYEVSSSYYEGVTCPLAQRGYNRDNKKGTPCIVYGVMTDSQGPPVSVDVYPGNTGDPATVEDQIERLRDRFGLGRVVFVGDRGMLTQARIGVLKEHGWVGWISALRSKAIRSLMDDDVLQLSLFDECDLAKITSPDYPQERLVACFNPRLQARRGRKRQVLIEATEQGLEAIARAVRRRTKKPLTADQIGVKVGRVLGKYKMAKHLIVDIKDNHLSWELNRESIEMEQRHGGVYVVRTSETRNSLAAEDVVRNFKRLIAVETAFRNLKSIDLLIRPIRHRTVERVKAHIFLSLLSYYVQKHIRDAWAPMLFAEEDIENRRKNRHPVNRLRLHYPPRPKSIRSKLRTMNRFIVSIR